MKSKILWISLSIILGLALAIGAFGCKAPPTTTTPAAPSPGITTSPAPAPKPTASPTPTAAPTAKPTTAAPTPAQPTVIKWKGQIEYAVRGPWSAATGHNMKFPGTYGMGLSWVDWIQRVSGGRLQIDVAPPGTYGSTVDAFDMVKSGIIDVDAHYYGGYSPGIMPESNIEIGMPFAWENAAESWDAYFNWGLFDRFQAIYAEQGIKWFPRAAGGGYNMGTTFPIFSVKDVKGKKIRALGIWAEWVKALGGSAVTVVPAELYMALKTGTVDGAIYGIPGLEDWKLKEVWKYYVVKPDPNFVTSNLIMNMNSFKKLPEDLQTLIQNAMPVLEWSLPANYWIEAQYLIASAQKQYGFTPVTWSNEDTAIATAAGIATWDIVAAKSPRCKELVDIVKAQARLLGKIK